MAKSIGAECPSLSASPDLLSPLDLDIPDFPSCNCEGPGGCQHLPPCVHGSTELLAVGAGGAGTLGVLPGLSVAGIHSKHSDLFPSYLLIQGHGNPTGRSGPDTPKTLIPGYSNGRGNLAVPARGWGCTPGQPLAQRQAVSDGGGLGISTEGRSVGVKQEPGVGRPSH